MMNTLVESQWVSIILLNWNGGEDTIECLKSLFDLKYEYIRVIMVDNGSSDGVAERVERDYPDVHVIKHARNLGFVEGNNSGIRYALSLPSEYIFLLNNDTIVDADCVTHFVNALEANPQLGVVGPKILNYYEPQTLESAGGKISFKFARSFAIGYGEIDEGQYDQDRWVDFVSGCSFFGRAKVFQKNHFFDRRYFAYYEDMDICCSLKQLGYDLGYVHQAKVWHKVSAATGGYKNPNALFWSTRNRFLFVHHCGRFMDKLFFGMYFLAFYLPGFCTVSLCLGRVSHVKAFLSGFLSLFKHSVHFSKDFPYRIAVDCLPMNKSKGGVGRYNAGLVAALDQMAVPYEMNHFHYEIENGRSGGLFSIFKQLMVEQVMLPLKILFKKVDLVHYPAFVSPIVKISKNVITIHDMAYSLFPKMFVWRYRMYLKVFVPWSARRADKIIAVSENTKKDIVRLLGVDESKVSVIYQSISPLYRKINDQKRIESYLNKFNINKSYILSVGTLEPRKNIRTLIAAFVDLMAQSPVRDLQLVIVGGKGWLYEEIFKDAAHADVQNSIRFTDYVNEEEMLCLYNAAKLFVYPSLYEGFGLPPLEAMACGVPVITSNVSSLPEAVGDAAKMFSPHDTLELIRLMKELLDDEQLCEELRAKGYEWVKNFSWDKSAAQTMEVYESVLKS